MFATSAGTHRSLVARTSKCGWAICLHIHILSIHTASMETTLFGMIIQRSKTKKVKGTVDLAKTVSGLINYVVLWPYSLHACMQASTSKWEWGPFWRVSADIF